MCVMFTCSECNEYVTRAAVYMCVEWLSVSAECSLVPVRVTYGSMLKLDLCTKPVCVLRSCVHIATYNTCNRHCTVTNSKVYTSVPEVSKIILRLPIQLK